MEGFSKYTNIPFVVPFAATFAEHLISAHPTTADPFALSKVTVWVPSQRAVKSLREALMAEAHKQRKQGLLLPEIRAMHLGEEDAELLAFDPALSGELALNPVPDIARLLYLARQVQYWQSITDGRHHIGRAYESAVSLKKLSDRMKTYGISFEQLKNLAPKDMATHWEKNIAFLKIVLEHYPNWLEESGTHDPAECRKKLLEAQAITYTKTAPKGAVYLAGFTDTVPAGRALMRAILAHENGRMVVQGMDVAAMTSERGLPPTHPQYGLKELLQKLEISAEDFTHVKATTPQAKGREQLLKQVMLPEGQTEDWLKNKAPDEAFNGVDYIPAASPREEADAIALMMRETLETPDKTAALVTTDRRLASQVADRLKYWDITVNDSAGEGLLRRPAGSFFTLVSAVAASRFAPLTLAQLFAHPLTYLGYSKSDFKRKAHRFEALLLRGPTPDSGLEGLHERLREVAHDRELTDEDTQPLQEMLGQLATTFKPFLERGKASLKQWVSAHLEVAQTLANDETLTRKDSFLEQEDGEALYTCLQNLMHGHNDSDGMSLSDYQQWLEAFLGQVEVREKYAQHPRLFIWGPLEARLQTADKIIIGGMNEGTWPNAIKPDPWLNREMAAELKLPPMDMATGLNAHDFSSLFANPDVTLTRAVKDGGTPTLPSRYLLRLEALYQLRSEESLHSFMRSGGKWIMMARKWATHLTKPAEATPQPIAQTSVEVVPTELSASSVRTLMTCPYQLYGQKVLKLQPLDPFDQAPDAADKGNLIHDILEAFFVGEKAWGQPVTQDALADAEKHLIKIAEEKFTSISSPASRALWLSRFRHAAKQFVAQEAQNHEQGRAFWLAERRGQMNIAKALVHARADRIDRTPNGAVLMDYKTGQTANTSAINSARDPQLAIEALLLKNGKYFFEGETVNALSGVELWKVGGTGDSGYARAVNYTHGQRNADPDALAEKAEQGLTRLVNYYHEDNAPFKAYADPLAQCQYCDFAGICRRHEWQKDDEAEAE